jgi:hypothetical protein
VQHRGAVVVNGQEQLITAQFDVQDDAGGGVGDGLGDQLRRDPLHLLEQLAVQPPLGAHLGEELASRRSCLDGGGQAMSFPPRRRSRAGVVEGLVHGVVDGRFQPSAKPSEYGGDCRLRATEHNPRDRPAAGGWVGGDGGEFGRAYRVEGRHS